MKIGSLAAIFLSTWAAPTIAETVETGDILQGYPVISKLNTSSLEDGSYKFWFRGVENAIGGTYNIPVRVKKQGDGPVIFLQSSIHGDELAGAQVIFELFKDLSERDINGTVVGIVGANPSGINLHSRYWYQTGTGGSYVDLNRLMPGDEGSSDSGERLAYLLWNNLYTPSKPSFFFDLHTQSQGTAFPFFAYADRRVELVDQIISVTPADIVKNDLGENGTVETEMINAGVPAVTLELGSPKEWDKEMNLRGVMGIKNGMKLMGMLDDHEINMMGVDTFECDSTSSVKVEKGGYLETIVELKDEVVEGDVVGYLFDGFGEVKETFTAPATGQISSIATDPIREPGSSVLRVCYPEPAEETQAVTKKSLRGPL